MNKFSTLLIQSDLKQLNCDRKYQCESLSAQCHNISDFFSNTYYSKILAQPNISQQYFNQLLNYTSIN